MRTSLLLCCNSEQVNQQKIFRTSIFNRFKILFSVSKFLQLCLYVWLTIRTINMITVVKTKVAVAAAEEVAVD